jgi:hypothetical protein
MTDSTQTQDQQRADLVAQRDGITTSIELATGMEVVQLRRAEIALSKQIFLIDNPSGTPGPLQPEVQ